MRTRIVRIGNSQGVRIPKLLLEEAGMEGDIGDVEIRAEDGRIVIERADRPREGWADAARRLCETGETAGLLLPDAPTSFDLDEWVWDEE